MSYYPLPHKEDWAYEANLRWYQIPHQHRCVYCGVIREHTGVDVLREGDQAAHLCCGKDIRDPMR